MKNHNVVPLSLFFLAIAFLIVSVIVYFTRGNNRYFLNKKLKIGAMIITLTAVTNGCRIPIATCYKPAAEPRIISMQSAESFNGIVINKKEQLLKFDTEFLYNSDISYVIYQNDEIVLKGDCVFNIDGETDLGIKLENSLQSGTYLLKLFDGKISNLKKRENILTYFTLKVNKSE